MQLIAAMNPCPCGHHGAPRCACSPEAVQRYRARVSGPLLDRIDMVWRLPSEAADVARSVAQRPVHHRPLTPVRSESCEVRSQVDRARARQQTRQGKLNVALTPAELVAWPPWASSVSALLNQAAERFGWSLRGRHRVMRVARTVADLQDREMIDADHVAEAVQFRVALH
jgi:magnesium chelatase family protein